MFNIDKTGLADGDQRERAHRAGGARPSRSSWTSRPRRSWRSCPRTRRPNWPPNSGSGEPGLDRLATAGFAALGLSTFLTTGPKETRAWTIRVGATAPEAAGVIHSDFQRGFIKAEIVAYDDLVAAGSLTAARAAGKARIEGKDYVMQDGDVVEFRFNV